MSSIKDLAARTANVTGRTIEKSVEKKGPRTAPVMMFEATARMHEAEEKVEQLQRALEEAKNASRLRKLPLADLVEVPGRRRVLTPAQYTDLKTNLDETKKLLEPIKVSPRPDGKWEIVSGNNKTAIARELGWVEIDCIVDVVDAAQADLDGFLANLLQNTLPAYEQYLGYKLLQKNYPDASLSDIARRTGKPKSTLTELMAFDNLPPAVHEQLRNNPHLLGYRAAAKLASYALDGLGAEVTAAVDQIATEGIDQTVAVQRVAALQAASPNQTDVPKKRREPVTIQAGDQVYCTMHRAAKALRLQFDSKEDAEEVEEAIRAVLQKRAEAKRAG